MEENLKLNCSWIEIENQVKFCFLKNEFSMIS
jgi:hypothetical protein